MPMEELGKVLKKLKVIATPYENQQYQLNQDPRSSQRLSYQQKSIHGLAISTGTQSIGLPCLDLVGED